MKRYLLFIFIIITMFALVACEAGEISSYLEIQSTTGAGTKRIEVLIWDDDAPKGDEIVEGQKELLPGGYEGIVNKLEKVCPLEDMKFELLEDEGGWKYFISMTYTFDSIDDYNKKTALMAQEMGMEYIDATIEVEGDQVTFKEDSRNFRNSIEWALDAVYNDPEVFDSSRGVGYNDFVEFHHFLVYVGDEYKEFDLDRELAPEYFIVTGTIENNSATDEPTPTPSDEPTPTQTPTGEPTPTQTPTDEPTPTDNIPTTPDPTSPDTPDEPPRTGDNGFSLLIILSILSFAGFIVGHIRQGGSYPALPSTQKK